MAAPVDREVITLTNRDWTFSAETLRKAANARRFRLLNDFEALAWSLPASRRLTTCADRRRAPVPNLQVKIVLGPGTGLGMAHIAHPCRSGGWMPIPGEMGHITLPVVTQPRNWPSRTRIMGRTNLPRSEDVLTGAGLLALYRAIADAAHARDTGSRCCRQPLPAAMRRRKRRSITS